MARTVLILAAGLVLAGCRETVQKQMGDVAIAELKAELRDPDSLQVADTKFQISSGWGAVCGNYNAANGFGGMAGTRRFVRVFDPEELQALDARDGASRDSRRALWAALQTKLQYDEELGRPGAKGADGLRARGLFMESIDPLLAVRRTVDRCALTAEALELKP